MKSIKFRFLDIDASVVAVKSIEGSVPQVFHILTR